MNISSEQLNVHMNSSIAAEYLFNSAKDLGFIVCPDDENRRYRAPTLGTLRAALITDLQVVDNFISANLESIQPFLMELKQRNVEKWTVSHSFLYELIILMQKPLIFTKEYQDKGEWNSGIAENVEKSLCNYLFKKYSAHYLH